MKKGAHHTRRAMAGADNAPLSHKQKGQICIRAKEAFDALRKQKLIADGIDFNDWRRDQQACAVDMESLRECVGKDFEPIMMHFENLLGNSDKAFDYALRAETRPVRVAMHHLQQECKAAEALMRNPMGYVRGYLRNSKGGITLEQADAKTVWGCVYMIRRKVQSLRAKAKGGGISAGSTVDDVLDSLGIPAAPAPTAAPAGAKGKPFSQPKPKAARQRPAPPAAPQTGMDTPY
ncbi:hypothetical protein DB346_02930 [Verrucomicrobia bacterium LW23]|nr:hypothetical protein DB346_03725 [Verrucomicrobia bacterium LW23]PTY04403.1 hypothetical protein DB346_02930 [Verrucomicrobia bacterium LW23]